MLFVCALKICGNARSLMVVVLGVGVGLSLNHLVAMHERVPMAGGLGYPLNNRDRYLYLEVNWPDNSDLLNNFRLHFLGLLNLDGS